MGAVRIVRYKEENYSPSLYIWGKYRLNTSLYKLMENILSLFEKQV